MTVHCNLCGKRISSLASLSGHYRRKHSGGAPAIRTGIGAATAFGPRQSSGIARGAAKTGISDAAYIAALPESESGKKSISEPESSAGMAKESSLDWWPWLLLLGYVTFALLPDSGKDGGSDSGLLSTYQPEGDGQ
ncbi:MAG: hypothetical protein WA876_02995 [Candidatus Acidiferrales bacterium]